jgi:hypothetical protein
MVKSCGVAAKDRATMEKIIEHANNRSPFAAGEHMSPFKSADMSAHFQSRLKKFVWLV